MERGRAGNNTLLFCCLQYQEGNLLERHIWKIRNLRISQTNLTGCYWDSFKQACKFIAHKQQLTPKTVLILLTTSPLLQAACRAIPAKTFAKNVCSEKVSNVFPSKHCLSWRYCREWTAFKYKSCIQFHSLSVKMKMNWYANLIFIFLSHYKGDFR